MNLRIKDLREDKDVTQKHLAEYLMCDQSLYSKYERGDRVIPVDILEKLALYYDTSVDFLMGRTDENRPYPKSVKKTDRAE